MGERKGQNFYYPPDFDYNKHRSLNHYHGTHALRERAKKIGEGILVIRFEMPFNIWCLGCRNHVGMGVRYNAEKKKIGMYFTTPLYEFRMKCHLCDNYYVIRTDPKNLDYELVEGCQRQEKRWEPTEYGQLPGYERTKAGSAMSQKMAADSMFKVEHGEKDKVKGSGSDRSIELLEELQYRMHDDYGANSALRNIFRAEKKTLSEQRARDDVLRARGNLTIPLAPEMPDDRRVAEVALKMAKFKSEDEKREEAREALAGKRIFDSSQPSTSSVSSHEKSAASVDKLKESVRHARNKRLNSQFEFGSGLSSVVEKRARMSLGIVRKSREDSSQNDGGSNGIDDAIEASEKGQNGIDVQAPETETSKDATVDGRPGGVLGLLTDYGSCSDTSNSDNE